MSALDKSFPESTDDPIADEFNATLRSKPADHFEAAVTAPFRAGPSARQQRRAAVNAVLDHYGIRRMWMAVKIILGVSIVCDAVAVVAWVLVLCGAR